MTRRDDRVAGVVRAGLGNRYAWGQGQEGWQLLDKGRFSLAEEQMQPGCEEEWHTHTGADLVFYVLAGRLEVRTSAWTANLVAGDAVDLVAGREHQIANPSDEVARYLVTSIATL